MAAKESAAPASSKPTGLRKRVHIQVRYAGKGQPGTQLRERCNTLVDMLVEADAGTIEKRKAGDGAADIYVVTRFAAHTIEAALRIANELGIGARTTIAIVDGKVEG